MFDEIIDIVAMSGNKIAIQYLDINKDNPHAIATQLTNNNTQTNALLRV